MGEKDFSPKQIQKIAKEIVEVGDPEKAMEIADKARDEYENRLNGLMPFNEDNICEILLRCTDFLQALNTEIQLIREQQDNS